MNEQHGSGNDNASKGSLLGRLNAAFQGAVQTSRGEQRRDLANDTLAAQARADERSLDDLAIRRVRKGGTQRMMVPEGAVIVGSVTCGTETEIAGRVDGDVTVDGRLYLHAKGIVTGNVKATSCRIEGLIEGKLECSQDVDLGQTGRVNSDAIAGKGVTVAGQVFGGIQAGGMLRLVATGRVEGNIHARQLVIEEGAIFNGICTMKTAAPRST